MITKSQKKEYINHRLELSEELKHCIIMSYVDKIEHLKQQIKELDEIIKIFFKK